MLCCLLIALALSPASAAAWLAVPATGLCCAGVPRAALAAGVVAAALLLCGALLAAGYYAEGAAGPFHHVCSLGRRLAAIRP